MNLSSKVVHRPKIHLLDTGLAAALTGLTAERLLDAPEHFGALLETFVVQELRKQLSWSETQPSLWHFRDRLGDRFHHGYLATTAPEAHPLEDRLSAIPVTALWSGDW